MSQRSLHTPDACTACTICVAHCPVAAATMNFRGPKLTGPAYERFRLLGFGDEASLEYCSNCKNCDISCPSGVAVATFTMLARAAFCREQAPPFRDWLLAHSGDMGLLAAPLPAWLLNLAVSNPLSRQIMHALGIDKRAPMPAFASLAARRALNTRANLSRSTKPLVFFPGCFIRYYDPQTGVDIIRLLELAGYSVHVPEAFVCCGLPLVAGGYAGDALDKARANSLELARWAAQDIPVVTACPSCALMLGVEYHELFPEEGLTNHGASLVDACELLVNCIRTGTLPLKNSGAESRHIAYHAPCHLRVQGKGTTGFDLLRLTPGVTVEDMASGCCGIAGSYGFKRGKYHIGMQVGAPLFQALRTSGASLGASECGTCRLQMHHGSGMATMHPTGVLARVLGVTPFR